MNTVDALIIGAGPAGSSCALHLVEHGWRVAMIDKSTFPRIKTCGGFIGPENKALLSDWGIWSKLKEQGAGIVEQSVITASHGASTIIPIHSEALGASRSLLDMLLLERVKDLGVSVYEGAQARQINYHEHASEVHIDHYANDSQFKINARHVIDASGHRPALTNGSNVQLGIFALYENMPKALGQVMLHCCTGGHVGINPFEAKKINLCYVVEANYFEAHGRDPQRVLDSWIKENLHLSTVMQGARRVTAWKAVYIPKRKPIVFYHEGLWRVGDSAAFIDTAIGGGISVALISGQLLAQSLVHHHTHSKQLEAYRHAYVKNLSGQRRLAALFGNLIHQPHLAQGIISLLNISSSIRGLALNYSRPALHLNTT